MEQKNINNFLFKISIFGTIFLSIFMVFSILNGNAHSFELIRILGGTRAIYIPNKYFDFSVIGIFICLLLFVFCILNKENE